MKTPLNTLLAILILVLGGVATSEKIDPIANAQELKKEGVATSEEIDPFANAQELKKEGVATSEEIDPFANAQEPKSKVPFGTTGGFMVTIEIGSNPKSIPTEDWPKIESPTNFNRYFDRANQIWRVDGGYFGAFRADTVGALFFATDKASKWTRIIDTPILDLQRFEDDTFLATGGCVVNNNFSGGAAYLITRRPSGKWQAKKVFSSWRGVPRAIGTSTTEPFLRAESKTLIVFCLEYPDSESFFGADASGAIHYLGVTPRTSEPAGADQPATKPADKPPVKNQPPTPTSKDVPR